MIRQLIAVALLCGFLPLGQALAHSEDEARAFVSQTADKAVAIIISDVSEEEISQKLEALFTKQVGIGWISRFVLGRQWRQLEEAQKKSYQENYRKFLIKNYTESFREYTADTTYKITRSRPLKRDGQYLVGMEINQPKNPQPIKIDYRLHSHDGAYQITDIVVEGVSLLTTQRSEFSSVIQRNGIEYLIENLNK